MTTNPLHTPGPWEAGAPVNAKPCIMIRKPEGLYLIAEFNNFPDAQISAAALDMKEALEQVVSVLDSPEYKAWMERVCVIDKSLLLEDFPRVDMDAARLALSKARGDSNAEGEG